MSDEQELFPTQQELPEWRRIWFENEWWFSVVDVIRSYTESSDPGRYWRNLKLQAKKSDQPFYLFIQEHIRMFPLKADDGRMRDTDTATEESLLRIIQSIPSKNAEVVKRALAYLGKQKIEELRQELSPVDQKRAEYRKQGYPDDWIETRIAELLARNELTDTWKERGAKDEHYPVLTNVLTEGTFGFMVRSYLSYKSLPAKANLQDNMTPEELAFSVIGKTTAQRLHTTRESQGFAELHRDVTEAGRVTGEARKLIEQTTGQSIVSPKNAKDLKQLPEKKRKKQKQLPPLSQQTLL